MGKNCKIGICKLCRNEKELNFEHVPPRGTFNKNTRYVKGSLQDFLKSEDILNKKVNGKIEQGGIGYYSFCEDCNNFLGTNYVRAFQEWTFTGVAALTHGKYDFYQYVALKQYPLKIIKHIVSMFVAINEPEIALSYPDLLDFIKNPQSKELNSRFRIYSYLNTGSNYRYSPITVVGSFKTTKMITCCEIAFPPFGYVLTIDSDVEKKYLKEITNFKEFDVDQMADVEMEIYKLQTHLPIALDYRTKDQIQEAIEVGKKLRKK